MIIISQAPDLGDIHGLFLRAPHYSQTSGKQGYVGQTLAALFDDLIEYVILVIMNDIMHNLPATACFSDLEGMLSSPFHRSMYGCLEDHSHIFGIETSIYIILR